MVDSKVSVADGWEQNALGLTDAASDLNWAVVGYFFLKCGRSVDALKCFWIFSS